MNQTFKTTSLLVLLLLFSSSLFSQGYEINVKFHNSSNQELILGHHFNDQLFPDDTIQLNSKGEGVFKGKEAQPGGMYFIYLSTGKYFDIILDKDQHFYLENDTLNFIDNVKLEGSVDNDVFFDYQRFLRDKNKEATEFQELKKSDSSKAKEIDAKMAGINTEVQAKMQGLIDQYPDMFFLKFLRATQQVQIPKEIKDRTEQYYYYKAHYFDFLDPADPRLLRTPIFQSRIDVYVDKIASQHPDSLIKEVDFLINKSRTNKELFRFMVVHLFNKFAKGELMGYENVYVHIADKYYIPEADWSDEAFISELKAKIPRMQSSLLYMTAPELKMLVLPHDLGEIEGIRDQLADLKEKGVEAVSDENAIKARIKELKPYNPNLSDSILRSDVLIRKYADVLEESFMPNFQGYVSLHQTESKYVVMWFWEPDCSHCRQETPKLHAAYKEKFAALDAEVFCVYLHKPINEWEKYTNHIEKWLNFVMDNELQDWNNVWDPLNNTNYRDQYNISSSPVLYLLDKDRKIIAKKIGFEQAVEMMERMEKE